MSATKRVSVSAAVAQLIESRHSCGGDVLRVFVLLARIDEGHDDIVAMIDAQLRRECIQAAERSNLEQIREIVLEQQKEAQARAADDASVTNEDRVNTLLEACLALGGVEPPSDSQLIFRAFVAFLEQVVNTGTKSGLREELARLGEYFPKCSTTVSEFEAQRGAALLPGGAHDHRLTREIEG